MEEGTFATAGWEEGPVAAVGGMGLFLMVVLLCLLNVGFLGLEKVMEQLVVVMEKMVWFTVVRLAETVRQF